MKPSNHLRQNHTLFTSWLTNDFRRLTMAPEILEPFRHYTELSPPRAIAFLQGGVMAPILFTENLGPFWGMFRPANPLMIIIHELIVAAVEADLGDPKRRTFAMATILQELVHCGREERGLDQGNDPGKQFEAEIFGRGTGKELRGADYLPEEFVPRSLRNVSRSPSAPTEIGG